MKLLLDENIDVRFRNHIAGHDVFTVSFMEWTGFKNGALIAQASAEGFDALITTDVAMASQINMTTLALSLVVLHVLSNDIDELRKLVPSLHQELNHLIPPSIVHVR